MATFALFVRPALRRLMGYDDGFWHRPRRGVLTAALPGAKGRDRFIPARRTTTLEGERLEPIGAQGSHDMGAFARADALIRVAARDAPRAAGETCVWLPLDG